MTARKKSELRRRPPSRSEARERRPARPTINDVARLANVSKKTVSRVINKSPFVRDATRKKIGAIIDELGFSPDPQARGLALRRSALIGLICDDPLPPDVGDVQQGILDALRGAGLELVIRACDRGDTKFLAQVRSFVEGQRLAAVLLLRAPPREAKLTGMLDEMGCAYAEISGGPAGQPARVRAFESAAKLFSGNI